MKTYYTSPTSLGYEVSMTTLHPVTHANLTLPGIRHAFFTRQGGVSTGIFASLNAGMGSTDNIENVTENRLRMAQYMGVEQYELLTCYQIHSAYVEPLQERWECERPEADAMVTSSKGIALGILTADCAPVLFADAEARVVGAAHAGWKGAFTGVLENTIDEMEKQGASRANIRAVIGPCIGPESYEVGDEFVARFTDTDISLGYFFTPNRPGHALFDLPSFVLHRLGNAGIEAEWCGIDTLTDEERFFSYRRKTLRNELDYGRQVSAICLI